MSVAEDWNGEIGGGTWDESVSRSTRFRRQAVSAFTLAIRRTQASKFLWAALGLAAIPVLIGVLVSVHNWGDSSFNVARVHSTYENLLRMLYLHFIVFFVANFLGFAVMRQEADERTLHYLFLQPVPRWILIVGKTAAYLALASVFCSVSLWLTYLIMSLSAAGVAGTVSDLFGEGRFVVLCKECLVMALGLLAYGSIAMLMGSLVKSGLYALILLAWESGLPYLPSSLKAWTVMHYLHSLLPERLTEQRKILELLGEPASVGVSILVVGFVSLVFIGICIALFQNRECLYKET